MHVFFSALKNLNTLWLNKCGLFFFSQCISTLNEIYRFKSFTLEHTKYKKNNPIFNLTNFLINIKNTKDIFCITYAHIFCMQNSALNNKKIMINLKKKLYSYYILINTDAFILSWLPVVMPWEVVDSHPNIDQSFWPYLWWSLAQGVVYALMFWIEDRRYTDIFYTPDPERSLERIGDEGIQTWQGGLAIFVMLTVFSVAWWYFFKEDTKTKNKIKEDFHNWLDTSTNDTLSSDILRVAPDAFTDSSLVPNYEETLKSFSSMEADAFLEVFNMHKLEYQKLKQFESLFENPFNSADIHSDFYIGYTCNDYKQDFSLIDCFYELKRLLIEQSLVSKTKLELEDLMEIQKLSQVQTLEDCLNLSSEWHSLEGWGNLVSSLEKHEDLLLLADKTNFIDLLLLNDNVLILDYLSTCF